MPLSLLLLRVPKSHAQAQQTRTCQFSIADSAREHCRIVQLSAEGSWQTTDFEVKIKHEPTASTHVGSFMAGRQSVPGHLSNQRIEITKWNIFTFNTMSQIQVSRCDAIKPQVPKWSQPTFQAALKASDSQNVRNCKTGSSWMWNLILGKPPLNTVLK